MESPFADNGTSIVRMCVHQSEEMLLALCADSTLYAIDLASDGEEIPVRQLAAVRPIIDLAFVDKTQAVLLCAETEEAHLVLFNIVSNEQIRAFGRKSFNMTPFEFFTHMSAAVDGKVIVTSNKGRCRILVDLDKVGSI